MAAGVAETAAAMAAAADMDEEAAAMAAATAERGVTDGRRCRTVRQGVEQQREE